MMLPPKTRVRSSEWETLCSDVGFSVLEKLLEPLDHVRFATVCKRWNSIAKDYNDTYRRWRSEQVLPMLMIPPSAAALSQGRELYSVSERLMYNSIRLPVPANEKYCGFSHGWLASIDECLSNITLRMFHAARNSRRHVIHLPPLIPEHSHYATKSIPKIILSADPTLHGDYGVLAIFDHGHKAAYFAEQRNSWKRISPINEIDYPKFGQAIFYRDSVYIIDTWGRSQLFRFKADVGRDYPEQLYTEPQISLNARTYLVESTNGSLLLVQRVLARKEVSATAFKVYQLVMQDYPSWRLQVLEVNSVGDEALFVCESHSMSVVASNFLGCQPNSIYYAYNSGSTWEVGIFSLENKTTTRLYSLNHGESSDNVPFWITPSFKGLCSES